MRYAVHYGNSPEVAYMYIFFGTFFTVLGNRKTSMEFFKLGIEVCEKFDDATYKSAIYSMYAAFSHPWIESWKTKEEYAKKSIQVGLQTGDLMYVAIACTYAAGFDPEMPLPNAIEEMKKYLNIVAQTKYQDMWDHNKLNIQMRNNLLGKTDDRLSLSDIYFNEEDCLSRMQKRNYYNGITAYYLQKSIICYTYGAYNQAYLYIEKASKTVFAFKGLSNYAEYCFYKFLIYTAIYSELSWWKKKFAMHEIKKLYNKAKKWATDNPSNFLCKLLLMQAEIARLKNKNQKAYIFYDQAIYEAKKEGFLAIEGIANELAAKLYLSRGQSKVAQLFIMEARYVYSKWGATEKIKYLEEVYPQLFAYEVHSSTVSSLESTNKIPGDLSTLKLLDLDSVLKSSQTISGEIVLEKLLIKMMNVVIENAGAEKGWLILEKNGEWSIEAEGVIDSKTINVMQSKPIDILPTSIIRSVIYSKETIVLGDATHTNEFSADPYIQRVQPKSVMCVPLLNNAVLIGLLYLENNLTPDTFSPERLETLKLLASQIAISIYNARLYTELKEVNESYECFVPKQFLTLLEKKSITDVKLGDQVQKEMTVMFCDIRDFTTLSENLTPQETLSFINEFYKRMEPIITKHHGIIDKYIGDAIMALYPTNADDALKSTIEMLNELEKYNQERMENNKAALRVGIGLNTGNLVLGTVGNEKRMEGSVISDAVNIASRVENLTKTYSANLLITKETYEKLADKKRYATRKISTVIVKGKSKPVTIYEVFNHDSINLIEAKQKSKEAFERGVDLFDQEKYAEACAVFELIVRENKDDLPAAVYYKKCRKKLSSF